VEEKIKKLAALCKKGDSKGLTQEENREFKRLEKSITGSMMRNEDVFNLHISAFKEAIGQ